MAHFRQAAKAPRRRRAVAGAYHTSKYREIALLRAERYGLSPPAWPLRGVDQNGARMCHPGGDASSVMTISSA